MKILFIISNDFGELSDAIYFTKGYNFDASVLLPPRLFTVNRETLPLKNHLYETLQDILTLVDREQPEIVFLFSAYLYAINQVLSLDDFKKLLLTLEQERCKVVTSDPFLGILANLNQATFNQRHPLHQAFLQHFSGLLPLLQNLTHLYTAPVQSSEKIRQVSFVNPNIIISPDELATYPKQLAQSLPIHLDKKRWLFVLSAEDYFTQVNLHSQAQFQTILYRKLTDAIALGCQPVLIAPKSCLEAISSLSSLDEKAIFLSYCPYQLFQLILLEAEYLFLWNLASNCVLSRVGNRQPIFFFHSGHLVQAIPGILRVTQQYGYSPEDLSFLDSLKPLQADNLAQQVLFQNQSLEPLRQRFLQSLTPDAAITQLLT